MGLHNLARKRPPDQLTYDPVLCNTLAMGELDGEDKPGVVNTPVLARTAVKFKLAKGFDLGKRWASIGRRYWTARRAHFYKPGKCALIHDGSSFKQESMVSVLGGFSAGEHITMHPPVQEPIPRIFFYFSEKKPPSFLHESTPLGPTCFAVFIVNIGKCAYDKLFWRRTTNLFFRVRQSLLFCFFSSAFGLAWPR